MHRSYCCADGKTWHEVFKPWASSSHDPPPAQTGRMEMQVWQLRREGAKLREGELDGPHRGWVRLARSNIAGEVTLHADLHVGTSRGAPAILQGLTAVEVRRLDERGLLLYGLQAELPAGPAAHRWPQVWFCQPVA